MLAVSGSILMLTFSVLLIRYGHVRYPYPGDELPRESRENQTKS
jgi:protein PsiE